MFKNVKYVQIKNNSDKIQNLLSVLFCNAKKKLVLSYLTGNVTTIKHFDIIKAYTKRFRRHNMLSVFKSQCHEAACNDYQFPIKAIC